jgi:hypothetical protein
MVHAALVSVKEASTTGGGMSNAVLTRVTRSTSPGAPRAPALQQSRLAQEEQRRRVGGSSRRRSRSARPRPDHDRQAGRSLRQRQSTKCPSRLRAAGRLILRADPEEVPHSRRQVKGGHVAGHVEQFEAEERHDAADNDPDQEYLGRDTQGRASGNLGR